MIRYGLYQFAGWGKYGAIAIACFIAGEFHADPYLAWFMPGVAAAAGAFSAFCLATAQNLLDPWRWED